MKGALAAAVMVVAFAASASAQEATRLSADGVGPVTFALSRDQIDHLGAPIERGTVNLEGDDYERYRITLAPERIVEVTFWDGQSTDISTTSADFTTQEGAHVGMTLAELRRLYPNGQFHIGAEEGSYMSFAISPGYGFSFDTDGIADSCFRWHQPCPTDLEARRATEFFLARRPTAH